MKLSRRVGATSQILQVFIADSSSTTGAGLTGLTNASAGLTAYYHRDTDTTATAISLVTMTVGTFTSSGFKEIDSTNMPGWYQFCPPNAALASGAASVALHLKGATNMAPLPIEIDLDSQVDVYLWNGTAVSTPATAGIPDINVKNAGNTAWASGSLTRAVFSADSGLQTSRSNTAQAGAAGSITLDASASATDSFYKGLVVYLTGGTGVGQARIITGYTGASKVATIQPNWVTNPDNTTTFAIGESAGADVEMWNNTAVASPATAGIPDINVKNINNAVAATPGAANGLVICGSNAATTFATLTSTGAFTINGVSDVAQTGDSFARIGANGSGLTSLATTASILSTALTESYAADGATFTLTQALYQIWSLLAERNVASTTLTANKLDGSTAAMTFTLNSATQPTAQTRTT